MQRPHAPAGSWCDGRPASKPHTTTGCTAPCLSPGPGYTPVGLSTKKGLRSVYRLMRHTMEPYWRMWRCISQVLLRGVARKPPICSSGTLVLHLYLEQLGLVGVYGMQDSRTGSCLALWMFSQLVTPSLMLMPLPQVRIRPLATPCSSSAACLLGSGAARAVQKDPAMKGQPW